MSQPKWVVLHDVSEELLPVVGRLRMAEAITKHQNRGVPADVEIAIDALEKLTERLRQAWPMGGAG